MMWRLDKTRIPAALHWLIPVVTEWGINDDYDREAKIDDANVDQLRELVSSIDGVADELFGWLGGPESASRTPSDEYVAFTCLTMAIASAKAQLERLEGR